MNHRLVIDVSSVPPRPAGAGRYAIELVSRLCAISGGINLVTKGRDTAFWRAFGPEDIVLASPNSRPLRIFWEQALLSRRLGGKGVNIYHGLHYVVPKGYRGATVSTIHDLTMIEHPEWHERSKVAYFARAIRFAVESADAIIVPSVFTRSRLEALFGHLEKIWVIHHGVDHARFNHGGEIEQEADPAYTSRRGEDVKVILHIGTIEPRKNIGNLIKGFDIFAKGNSDARLVLVGQRGWNYGEVFRTLSSLKHRERISEIGYIAEDDLIGLMRKASCVAYPSFAEGFGLPVLEAMAVGVPVVTSAGTVMEEVAGDCAWLCDALDPIDIADKLEQATSGSVTVSSKVARGAQRAKEFDWAKSATRHLEVYRALGFGSES